MKDKTHLSVSVVLELLPDERIERVPVVLCDIPADTPQVAEDERRTQYRVQFGGVLVQIRSAAAEKQGFQQPTQGGDFTDVNLRCYRVRSL